MPVIDPDSETPSRLGEPEHDSEPRSCQHGQPEGQCSESESDTTAGGSGRHAVGSTRRLGTAGVRVTGTKPHRDSRDSDSRRRGDGRRS
jgi:hypothetical protein